MSTQSPASGRASIQLLAFLLLFAACGGSDDGSMAPNRSGEPLARVGACRTHSGARPAARDGPKASAATGDDFSLEGNCVILRAGGEQ